MADPLTHEQKVSKCANQFVDIVIALRASNSAQSPNPLAETIKVVKDLEYGINFQDEGLKTLHLGTSIRGADILTVNDSQGRPITLLPMETPNQAAERIANQVGSWKFKQCAAMIR